MTDYFRKDVAATLAELNTDSHRGLSQAEAARRLAEVGRNTLPREGERSLLKVIIGQFANIMVLVLIAAAVISLLLGDVKDMIVILVIVVLNALLGTYQEYRAEQALAALSAMQVPTVRVRRDGEVHPISAEEIVPGDVVLLQEGDRVPADGRVITSINLQVEEAMLTGESHAVFKETGAIDKADVSLGDRINMVFMGTAVTYGRGEYVVTDTGLKSQLGKIAAMLMGVDDAETPLQRRLDHLSKLLVRGAIAIVVVVFIVGILRGIPANEMLISAISLAVAAVPEGLPAVITISLSLGAARMVKRHALIRRLPAVETLGSVTTICSDKTGTLTRNEMTATLLALPGHEDVVVTGIGYQAEGEFLENGDRRLDPHKDMAVGRFLRAMAISTDAFIDTDENGNPIVVGDTTEGALVVAAQKVGWTREALERDLPRVAELPFSSDRKAMTTIHDLESDENRQMFTDQPYIAFTKGAPDRLLEWAKYEHLPEGRVDLTPERRTAWERKINQMASEGLRVLGIGYRELASVPEKVTPEIESDLTLLGLIGILDPARPEARNAVKVAREAGIRPIMITGDHALTAEAIASDLGIIERGTKAITGSQLEKMDDAQIREALKTTSAFARVSPEHKLRLVKTLQESGEVVAMTGDGVNDAPALKQADIGVAMGITGTEVSKGAADMVLTDDNFASIVAAVEEGRVIYDNLRKFVLFLLSSNVGEILVMFVGILIGLPIPLLAIQILWVNLATDGLPAIALGFEPGEPDVMKRKPRPTDESIFAHGVGRKIIWRSVLLAALTLFAFVIAHTSSGLDPFSRTRGIENLSREQLIALGAEGEVPDNWDSLNTAQRVALALRQSETAEQDGHGESSENELLAALEKGPRTIAFTVLALGQLFHVLSIHAGDHLSVFKAGFRRNRFMLYALLITVGLQLLVIYLPFLQQTFETTPLSPLQLIFTVAVASGIMWVIEAEKFIRQRRAPANV